MQVKEIMTQDVETVTPDTLIRDAAHLMREVNAGFLPVGEEDQLIGTLTDRDIVVRSVAEGQDPKVARVREAMSEELVYCFEDDDVTEAAALMGEKQIRRLPVVNSEKRLVGVLSIGDIARETTATELTGQVVEDVTQPTSTPSAT